MDEGYLKFDEMQTHFRQNSSIAAKVRPRLDLRPEKSRGAAESHRAGLTPGRASGRLPCEQEMPPTR